MKKYILKAKNGKIISQENTNYQVSNFYGIYVSEEVVSILNKTIYYPINDRYSAIARILFFFAHLERKSIYKYPQKVHSDIWQHYFTKNQVVAYKKILLDNQLLIENPQEQSLKYKPGEYSTSYTLGAQYLAGELCFIQIENSKKKVLNIEFYEEKFWSFEDKAITFRANFTLENVYLRTDKAIEEEHLYHLNEKTSTNSLNSRLISINNFYNNNNIKKGINNDRVYHKICNLSKQSRKYLTDENGFEFFSIDIKNCQPLLLIAQAVKHGIAVDDSYKKLCELGTLYEQFIRPNRNRDQAKEELYKCVYFAQIYNSPINKEFRLYFPKSYKAILELTAAYSRSLALMLQKLEAQFFNQLKPKYSTVWFTLYDAIYFNDERDLDYLENYLQDEFQKLGISPKFDKKYPNGYKA